MEVESFDSWVKGKNKVEEVSLSGTEADSYAKDKGLDLKKVKGSDSSELANGGPIDSIMIDIVSDLEKETGFEFEVTSGNDIFHKEIKRYKSNHTIGKAIDIKSSSLLTRTGREKLEHAIIDLMISGKYNTNKLRLGAINEYDRPSSSSSGGHFHISLTSDKENRDNRECTLPLAGISSYAQIRDMIKSGTHASGGSSKGDRPGMIRSSDDNEEIDLNTPVAVTKTKSYYKVYDKENRRTLIAKYKKEEDKFKIYTKNRKEIGEVIEEGGVITLTDSNGSKDVTNSIVGKTFKRLFNNIHSTSNKTSKSEPSFSSIGDDFYKSILSKIGANETAEKIKFLKAWRQAEGGKATNNPFNTTFKLSSDPNISDYNTAGVKNYSTPDFGIDATSKTLLLPYYSNLILKLKDDNITSDELASEPSLKTWGTGGLVAKVLDGGNINPPPIYT